YLAVPEAAETISLARVDAARALIARKVPPELAKLVGQMLARDPADRPAAGDIADALSEISWRRVETQPVAPEAYSRTSEPVPATTSAPRRDDPAPEAATPAYGQPEHLEVGSVPPQRAPGAQRHGDARGPTSQPEKRSPVEEVSHVESGPAKVPVVNLEDLAFSGGHDAEPAPQAAAGETGSLF